MDAPVSANSVQTISREVLNLLLMQVHQGRLTRRSDIEQYLANRFCVHHVIFDLSTNLYIRHVACLNDYIYAVLDQVPMHREVTARGYIVHSPDQVKLLEAEGFTVLEPIRPGYSPRVKEYQKFLFDFEKETDIPMQVLTQVNEKGLAGFLK